jgi:hypothetical protein
MGYRVFKNKQLVFMLYLNLNDGRTNITTVKNDKEVKPEDFFRVLLGLMETGLKDNEILMLSYIMAQPEKEWSFMEGGDEFFMDKLDCKKSTVYNAKTKLVEENILSVSQNGRTFSLTDKWKTFAVGLLRHERIELGMCFRIIHE